VLTQLFPPDDERLSLETCRGGKINTLKKVKKSASSWLKIHNCLRMHGQQNMKKKSVIPTGTYSAYPPKHNVYQDYNTFTHYIFKGSEKLTTDFKPNI
jgi:hypothetical protein